MSWYEIWSKKRHPQAVLSLTVSAILQNNLFHCSSSFRTNKVSYKNCHSHCRPFTQTLFHCWIDMPCGHTSPPMILSSMIVVNLATRTLCTCVSRCADDVSTWCKSHRLQLNANKTEAIWFGSQANLARLNSLDSSLRVGSSTIVRNLGLHLDNELSMKQHVTKVAATCYYHLCRLHQIHRRFGSEVTT